VRLRFTLAWSGLSQQACAAPHFAALAKLPGMHTQIRDAIREERPVSVCLLNYRKDKTPFWNAFRSAE
jgi:hypothetical protein